MRRVAPFAILLATCMAGLWLVPGAGPMRAEDVLGTALRGAAPGSFELRQDYCWLESYGIGIALAPVPGRGIELPRLIAGQGSAALLYETGPNGTAALIASFEARGAQAAQPREYSFTTFGGSLIHCQSVPLQQSDGGFVLLTAWPMSGREFALVLSGRDQSALEFRRDALLRGMSIVPNAAPGSVAPLLLQGRHACVLPGFERDGERFFAQPQQGRLALRFFQVAAEDFTGLNALQFQLEEALARAGFRRSDGAPAGVREAESFLGEYFGGDGFVQRILFAQLQGGYLVALMQAPESAREQLAQAARALAASITRVDMHKPAEPGPAFGNVQKLRCVAWQEERSLHWGVLFDDSQGRPVVWRQPGIAWTARLVQNGGNLAQLAGTVSSSRELNPLSDAPERALALGTTTGEVELQVRVGNHNATARVTLR